MRNAAIIIQSHTRRWMAQQRLSQLKQIANYENWAANCIQKNWRCFQQKNWFEKLRHSTTNFQAHCRGFLVRNQFSPLLNNKTKAQSLLSSVIPIDSQSSHSDEAFASKGSSQVWLKIFFLIFSVLRKFKTMNMFRLLRILVRF